MSNYERLRAPRKGIHVAVDLGGGETLHFVLRRPSMVAIAEFIKEFGLRDDMTQAEQMERMPGMVQALLQRFVHERSNVAPSGQAEDWRAGALSFPGEAAAREASLDGDLQALHTAALELIQGKALATAGEGSGQTPASE